MQSPESPVIRCALPAAAHGANSSGEQVFAVHGVGGKVVAASDDYRSVARAFGCSHDGGPSWLVDVAALLAAGHPVVRRQDRSVDGRRMIASEHVPISDTTEGSALIASRYRFADTLSEVRTPEPRRTDVRPLGMAAQRLADVLRMSSEWLYETDADLALTYISDRVHDDIGVLPAVMIGQRLTEIGVFDGGPRSFDDQLDPQRRRPFADRMADLRHADGSLRRVRFSGVPVFVGEMFAGYRGVARDETRQQSASDAAARAESRLTVGLAASRDGFAVFDASGLMVCANPQIASDLGRRAPLPEGMDLGKLLNHALSSGWFVDTDAPSLDETRPGLSDPAGGQAMIEIGVADGRRLLFCTSRTDCNDILLISTDITAIKAAQISAGDEARKSA